MENINLDDESYLFINGTPRKLKTQSFEHIRKFRLIILEAAHYQNIDPNTLGAILIDEYLRMGLLDWFDWVSIIGRETTIGIGQVNVETASGLIKQKLYNPNPADEKLKPETIDTTSKAHLYIYIDEPAHSTNLSAAKIRYDINRWSPEVDISDRPDILGTLYSREDIKVHSKPESNDRGRQIANEFYPIAKDALSE